MALLVVLGISNFYGLYSNQFYFLKPDNYIFPLLSLVHFLYVYVLWFKITQHELPDPKMRNLEYVLYGVMIVYLFKVYDTVTILNSYSNYQEHVMPATFKPVGYTTLIFYCLLLLLTMVSFLHRKLHVGKYNFENYNDNLNIWQ